MSSVETHQSFRLPKELFEALAVHQSTRLQKLHWIELTSKLAEAALDGGKFLRPQLYFLVLGAFDRESIWSKTYFDVALSLEWIHAYSLVHDDLPCMDDDDMRRGKPTIHKLSNEAQALLTGDALLTGAFELLSNIDELSYEQRVLLIKELSFAASGSQLIAGQVRDLQEIYAGTVDELLLTHTLKTGALFGCATAMAAISVSSKNLKPQLSEFRNWGRDFGILYQLIDDHLDQDGVTKLLGAKELKEQIFHRMESLADRAKAMGWDATDILERFEALVRSK